MDWSEPLTSLEFGVSEPPDLWVHDAITQTREVEYCLSASTNYQYQLYLKDSCGDSWSTGAWLMIEGEYGNRIFKSILTASREEVYTLSLYYAVKKADQWKLTSGSVSGDWTQYNFADSAWSQVTLGSVTTPVSGTQYFRKQYTGLPNMAAYELSLNYRFGVVAYINGNEVYRDNMPEGPVSSSTMATGSYDVISFHKIIRPGAETANSQSILAVELHFTASGQSSVDFDAYLALYASTVTNQDESCFIYPYDVTLSASAGSSVANILD